MQFKGKDFPSENDEVPMAHWWRRDELVALLQAWQQTLEAPRDREDLDPSELQSFYARFDALRPRDGARIAITQVESQRQRLIHTFHFLKALNMESTRMERPTWFQLPPAQQDYLCQMGDLAVVAQDEFDLLAQICDSSAPPSPPQRPLADEMQAAAEALAGLPMFRANSVPKSPLSSSLATSPERIDQFQWTQDDSENESQESDDSERFKTRKSQRERDLDRDYTPPKGKVLKAKMTSKWSKRDEERLLTAWHQVMTKLASDGFAGSFASRNEGLRLNSLIHQRYVELCGKKVTPRTNQSTGAKKHAILMAFRALRNVLRTLASQRDRPNWFGMTPEERLQVQKKYGHHNEQACLIEKVSYQRLVEIDRAQQTVLTPRTNAPRAPATLDQLLGRKEMDQKIKDRSKFEHSRPDNSFEENESSDELQSDKMNRRDNSRGLLRSRHRDYGTNLTRETTSPIKRRRCDLEWITRLLDTQTQRFEAFLAEFQEERRQERERNLEIILEALKLRKASTSRAEQPSQFVETLVEKQRQNLLDLFSQLQDERAQERELARTLLRQVGGNGRTE